MATPNLFGQSLFGKVSNFRDARNKAVTVLVFDSNNQLRDWPVQQASLDSGIPFYLNDTVRINYRAATIGATPVCDVITVNPSTGAESVASTISFTASLQKSVILKCTAINAGSGVATLTTSYEVW